jgi:hypothetical protein
VKRETKTQHGTVSGYVHLECREECCRAAWRENQRRLRAIRLLKPVPDHVHGTINGYNSYGCRCDECTAVAAERRRTYRDRKDREWKNYWTVR